MTRSSTMMRAATVSVARLAGCFPAVDRGGDDVDTDTVAVDTATHDTTAVGDTQSPDIAGLDCATEIPLAATRCPHCTSQL